MKYSAFLGRFFLLCIFALSCKDDDPVPFFCYILSTNTTVDKIYNGITISTYTYSYTYTYNAANKVATMKYSSGGSTSVTTYNYDLILNAISSVRVNNGSGEPTTATFTYDTSNRLTEYDGAVFFTYNAYGQLTSYSTKGIWGTANHIFSYPNTTTKNYNSSSATHYVISNVVGIAPFYDTSTATYEYDDKMNPRKIEFNPLDFYLTDNNQTKITVTDSKGNVIISTTTYEYNDKGFPTRITTMGGSNSSTTTLTYNCK